MGQQATPAADHLFKVNEDGRKLGEDQSDAFHHTVYQLLFAANRARRDIQTAVSFLTTRVKAPDEDDWGKLKRVLQYLNGTKHLKLTLQADQLKFAVHWYVDGSHQIHEDCRGQTGSLVTFGKGAVSSSSTKMKQNTKSSTETEHLDPRVPHVFQNWSPENLFTNWDRSDLELKSDPDLGLIRPQNELGLIKPLKLIRIAIIILTLSRNPML